MHMSETLQENKEGRLRSVRGVHLSTVPREHRFSFTPHPLFGDPLLLNTYT